MEIGFWLFIVFLLVSEPIIGYFVFKKFKRNVKTNPGLRIKYYFYIIIGLWIPTIFIFFLVAFTDLKLHHIGLAMPTINTDTLGTLTTYIGFSVGILYLLLILYYGISYKYSKKAREKINQANQKQKNEVVYAEIFPVTSKEKKVWNYVSLTAGITEEIIYRGFLIYAILFLFPNMTIWLVLLISSVLFGLAHSYQGFTGVIKTTIIGLFFTIIYIGLGSILPLIAFHFCIDYIAKFGEHDQNNATKTVQ